jgi:histidinol phosphatase-like PHP family hydrolase
VEGTILDVDGSVSVDEASRAKIDICLVDVCDLTKGIYANPPATPTKQVENFVTAMLNMCQNPVVDVVAHPFNIGRTRPPLMLESISLRDYRRVARAFADNKKYFEVMNNMWWWFPNVLPRHFKERYLDVIRIFLDEGVRFSIGSDSHDECGVGNIAWSQRMLREAEVPPGQIIRPQDFLKP